MILRLLKLLRLWPEHGWRAWAHQCRQAHNQAKTDADAARDRYHEKRRRRWE